VVARSYWRALQGLQQLKPRWQRGAAPGPAHAQELLQAVRTGRGDPFPSRIDKQLDEGAAAIAWARAAQRVEAEFELPFLAHAPLEPLNATVEWQGDAIEVWLSTQNPADTRAGLARAFGLSEARVRIHQRPCGGGFGRRLEWSHVLQAARIAQALGPGRKVKTIWSREADLASGHYRPACAIRARLALGADGLPTGLRVDIAGGRIERSTGVKNPPMGDVPELASQMGWLRQRYAIPAIGLRHTEVERGVPLAYWRSVGASQNSFAFEVMLDLAARRAGQDPVAYRRRLLAAAPRTLAFVDALAAQADWARPLPPRCFRGLAINEANGAISGHVAEIELLGAKRFRVRRLIAGVDAGWAANPDAVKAQLMGGTVFGLAATLFGEIDFDAQGAVRQRNFGDYRLPRLAELPAIELLLLEGAERPGGVGEEGVPTVAPALANALLAASGVAPTRLPISRSGWEWVA
jgi:isoquinoline 1-oxidoreductase beta subunit